MKLLGPEKFYDLDPREKKWICNGTGAAGTPQWIVKILDSFGGFGINLSAAADIHDYMYFKGGKKLDKIYADILYWLNMLILISNDMFTLPADNLIGAWLLSPLRILRATLYFTTVLLFGWKAYGK